MAQHKAATEITIAQEERSAFAQAVDRYKFHGLAALGAVAAAILWMQSSSEAAVEHNRADWEKLYDAQVAQDGPTALASAAQNIERSDVAAWARVGQAMALIDDRNYDGAQTALEPIFSTEPVLLTGIDFPVGPDGAQKKLADHIRDRITVEKNWVEAHNVFENPPLPEDAPRVEIETDKGTIVVGLYSELAPVHVKNFLQHVESGYYEETLFHRIQPGDFIQGGDPNTKDGDPSTWGLGGPAETIQPEDTGLVHAAGALAAAKKGGDPNSSGSQFYICASPMYEFDGRYVVYGTVLEGLELVEEISNAELRTGKPDAPVDPVKILKTRKL